MTRGSQRPIIDWGTKIAWLDKIGGQNSSIILKGDQNRNWKQLGGPKIQFFLLFNIDNKCRITPKQIKLGNSSCVSNTRNSKMLKVICSLYIYGMKGLKKWSLSIFLELSFTT